MYKCACTKYKNNDAYQAKLKCNKNRTIGSIDPWIKWIDLFQSIHSNFWIDPNQSDRSPTLIPSCYLEMRNFTLLAVYWLTYVPFF